jgi:ribosomal protein S18 acetylase RimI-like enzyme
MSDEHTNISSTDCLEIFFMITEITYNNERAIDFQKLLDLYDSVGWTTYTSDPETLQKAINNSLYCLTAWSGQQLVGLLRAVGDGLTIIYIQDIIVLESFRRQGIGRALIKRTLDKYENVRQVLLLTDEQPNMISFYKSVGFQQTKDLKLTSFIRLKQRK